MGNSTMEQQSRKRAKVKATNKIKNPRAALRWWIGTVVLTLFPTLTTLIVAAVRSDANLTIDIIFKDGELILSSFLIVTSTLVSCYDVKEKTIFTDVILFSLLGSDFIQLILYTVFKTNPENDLLVIASVSIISLLVSIFTSWTWYLITCSKKEEVK